MSSLRMRVSNNFGEKALTYYGVNIWDFESILRDKLKDSEKKSLKKFIKSVKKPSILKNKSYKRTISNASVPNTGLFFERLFGVLPSHLTPSFFGRILEFFLLNP